MSFEPIKLKKVCLFYLNFIINYKLIHRKKIILKKEDDTIKNCVS